MTKAENLISLCDVNETRGKMDWIEDLRSIQRDLGGDPKMVHTQVENVAKMLVARPENIATIHPRDGEKMMEVSTFIKDKGQMIKNENSMMMYNVKFYGDGYNVVLDKDSRIWIKTEDLNKLEADAQNSNLTGNTVSERR